MKNSKIRNWWDDHKELITAGAYCMVLLGVGTIVGYQYHKCLIDAGMTAACLADPTLGDHITKATEKAMETMTKIKG